MAAGRGEFLQSLSSGLETTPAVGRMKSGSELRWATGVRDRLSLNDSTFHGGFRSVSGQDPRTEKSKVVGTKIEPAVCETNLIEMLPSEVQMKIVSYLDASSLVSISLVSKHFHHLVNDSGTWQQIYMAEFGGQMWRPKKDPTESESRTGGNWKKMYFRAAAGQEVLKWRRELRHVSVFTGLPMETEWVLRNLGVSWDLTVCDCWGREITLQQSRTYFSESAVILCWDGSIFPNYNDIGNIQLHGVRKEAARSPGVTRPAWRSLILKLDVKAQPCRFIGRDRLIKLILLPPGVIVGVWRGQEHVAFITISLHLHKLFERSLLGSSSCPYSEPVDRPPVDNSDPETGLHGYTLHFVLHTTGTEIMCGDFRNLSCHRAQIQRGLVQLKVIEWSDVSQHRALSGNMELRWRSEALGGSVENCCIMTLTLLDNSHKPFWCVSSPVSACVSRRPRGREYDGEDFVMKYRDPDGQVKMRLLWLKEQKLFFVLSLTVYISVLKVNKHFSRAP